MRNANASAATSGVRLNDLVNELLIASGLSLVGVAAARWRGVATNLLRNFGVDGLSLAFGVKTKRIKHMPDVSDTGLSSVDQVTKLIYELLDAHCDTADLARGLTNDSRWAAHLDYLRDLQRVGRETLATLAVLEPSASLDGASVNGAP